MFTITKMEEIQIQRQSALGWCMFVMRVCNMVQNNAERFPQLEANIRDVKVEISAMEVELIVSELMNKELPHPVLRDYLRQMHEVESKFEEGPFMLEVFYHRHSRLLKDQNIRSAFLKVPNLVDLLKEKSLKTLLFE
jgi:hypothetical protein